ncbi:AAA family ATPase [Asaia prunellae]|uniref:AAA family ATPase n=1 Tax=Asaia prunellae TaxID=610245 RepID=UPI00046EC481|nr:AAA family ATPase [Asaia prunellae]
MRIVRLDLIRYGNFADRHYDFPASPADFQVLYGANEAGKSTTLSAISDLLFGFPNLKSQDWLFDASLLRVGATLEQDNTRLAIIRKRGRAQTLLAPDDTTPLDENALISWLGSVDRAAFERMWSLDHQRLRAGGDAMARFEGDLGQQLLAAGFGLENVQSVLDALDTKAGAIWKKGGRGTKLGELKKAFDTARSDLLAAERARDTWTALNNEARAIEASRKDLEEAITALRHERARLERLKRLRTELIELDGLNAFLQAAPAPLFTPQEHEQFDHLLHRWTDAVQKRNDLQQKLDGLTETRAGYQPDLDLLSHETEIRAFRTRFEALGHRQTDHEEETQLNGMEAALQAGGYTGTAEEILSHLPGEELLAQLRPLARSYDALGLREENWRRNYNAARENLARAEASLGADIPPALRPLQNALEQAAAVRDIDTTINTLERTLRETRTQMDQSLRNLLPWQDDPQMLDTMAVPEPGFLETQRDNWREREKTIALLREAIRTLDDERERHLLEKAQIEQRDIVSLATLNQERAQRNGLFDALMTAPYDTQKRDAYLASRLLADQSADRRFDNAEILARLSQTDHAVERCILERKQQASRLDALIEAHDEAEREWREVLTERGLPLLPPDHLPGWLALRQKALETRTRFETLKTEHEAATRTRKTILSTLRALLPDLAPYDTLSDTLIDARKQSLDREKEAARFSEREKEHDIARATLQARQYEGEAIAQDRKNLETRWHEVLPDTPVWSLDEVQKLTDLRQKANTLAYRRAALTAYRTEIATLEEEFRLFMVSLDRENDLVLTTPMAQYQPYMKRCSVQGRTRNTLTVRTSRSGKKPKPAPPLTRLWKGYAMNSCLSCSALRRPVSK